MARKNRTLPDTWTWVIHLIIGVFFMVGIVFLSDWRALRTTEGRFCQTLDFVKSQSTSFEKYNDIVAAKALRRTAVSVHQLAQDPALDLSDPQCLKEQTEKRWDLGTGPGRYAPVRIHNERHRLCSVWSAAQK